MSYREIKVYATSSLTYYSDGVDVLTKNERFATYAKYQLAWEEDKLICSSVMFFW